MMKIKNNENFLEIIVTYNDDRKQDIMRFDASTIDLKISLSNWILLNDELRKLIKNGDLAKLSCMLKHDTATKEDLFIQDLIQTNGKFYFNQ